jgi:anti-sigma B factor antagonist
MELKIETGEAEGVSIVSCRGRIVFGDEAIALRDTLKALVAKKVRSILLDLSGVTYIDSGGLGTLVGAYSSARAAGTDIKLTGIGQRIRDVLQITKLVTVFEVYETESEALAAFGKARA